MQYEPLLCGVIIMNEIERMEAYIEKCEEERSKLLAEKEKIEIRIKRLTKEIYHSHQILNAT